MYNNDVFHCYRIKERLRTLDETIGVVIFVVQFILLMLQLNFCT